MGWMEVSREVSNCLQPSSSAASSRLQQQGQLLSSPLPSPFCLPASVDEREVLKRLLKPDLDRGEGSVFSRCWVPIAKPYGISAAHVLCKDASCWVRDTTAARVLQDQQPF